MATKNVDLNVLIRDTEGNIVSTQNALGTTEDEGVTVIVPAGYVSDIGSVPIADVTVKLIPLPIDLAPTAVVSRTDDLEANTCTVVFQYP